MSEHVENDVVQLVKQNTKLITSDILTKPLGKQDFHRHSPMLMSTSQGKIQTIPNTTLKSDQHASVSTVVEAGVTIPFENWMIHSRIGGQIGGVGG